MRAVLPTLPPPAPPPPPRSPTPPHPPVQIDALGEKDRKAISDAQQLLKPLGGQGLGGEKQTRQASVKLSQAKGAWDDARRTFESASKLQLEAVKLYNEAAKLGEAEEKMFGETL